MYGRSQQLGEQRDGLMACWAAVRNTLARLLGPGADVGPVATPRLALMTTGRTPYSARRLVGLGQAEKRVALTA